MSLLIACAVGAVAGFAISGKLHIALTARKKLAYKAALAGLREAQELRAAAVLRHVIASEMQADKWTNA